LAQTVPLHACISCNWVVAICGNPLEPPGRKGAVKAAQRHKKTVTNFVDEYTWADHLFIACSFSGEVWLRRLGLHPFSG
jgi:hypothetical protein